MSNYSTCKNTLSEMIVFYQYFGATGEAFQPVLNYYKDKENPSAAVREHNPGTAEEQDDFLALDREQQKKEQQQKPQSKTASASEAEENVEPDLPLGQLTLKDDYTTATMKLRFNSDGDLIMMIKSTSSSKVDCIFEGMCEVQNGVVWFALNSSMEKKWWPRESLVTQPSNYYPAAQNAVS